MTLTRRRIILALCVLLFVLSVPLAIFYALGYRWNSLFQLYQTGGLYISSPITSSTIYINEKAEAQTNIFQSGFLFQSLTPGKYKVTVAKDGYWPWSKTLAVKAQLVTEARAMLMAKNPDWKLILKENYTPLQASKYNEILNILKSPATTTDYARLTANQKEKLLWNPKSKQIWVTWLADSDSLPYYFCDDNSCKDNFLIFDSPAPIRNADFYPGRRDVVIIAMENGIFALEIDGRGGRNLQPIYKGKEPTFVTSPGENSIYILDEYVLIQINLE